jgi:tRNA nucleotidyltransferase (CCA-adding enzyme)
MQMEKNKISYSAVVLSEPSKKRLLNLFLGMIPEGWEKIAHHMTICLGELPENLKNKISEKVQLSVVGVGMSDKALAVKVDGFYSKNKIPHITIAIDRIGGAKPVDSNKIESWANFGGEIYLTGYVEEIESSSNQNESKKQIKEQISINNIKDLPFSDDVKNAGGKIFSVGGRVRDEFLGKDSKDLDILITNIGFENLEQILSKYGKVDLVGKSFGIIKFKPKGSDEEIDIAIPRTDRAIGSGHKGFEITADPNLPIESDLMRRDFTINAIAKDIDGNILDPFNGLQDLKDKIIRAVSKKSFSEDALRMIRAVQFASRFGFKIEPETKKMIKDNAHNIKEISKERILIEFDKIVKKGKSEIGIKILDETNLFKNIFDFEFKGDYNDFKNVKNMSDFIYLCFSNQSTKASEFYKNNLKGEIQTTKELEALEMTSLISGKPEDDRAIVMRMISKYPNIQNSGVLSQYVKELISEMNSGKYPKSLSDLNIDGNDLIEMGFKGKEIGEKLSEVIINIFKDNLKNKKQDIMNFLNKKNNLISESSTNEINHIAVFDFDNTTINSPEPEKGKKIWKEKTGKEWEHKGWWGKIESLSTDVFDLKPIRETLNGYNRVKNDPSVYKVLLTGRIGKFENQVKKILDSFDIKLDEYLFNNKGNTLEFKIYELEELTKKFPNATIVELWEDREEHFPYFERWGKVFESKNPGINRFILHKIKED